MPDREKVVAGLTMLADRKNDNSCEGLKCCKIAEDTLDLLQSQPQIVRCKDCKHYVHVRNDAAGYCAKDSSCWVFRDLEWFCADGEKKDGE